MKLSLDSARVSVAGTAEKAILQDMRTLASLVVWPALIAVLTLALALRLIGITYGYPYLLEVDEMAVIRSTMDMIASHSIDPHFYYYGPILIYIESLWLLPYLAIRALLGHPGVPLVMSYDTWTATIADPVIPVYGRIIFVLMGVASVWLAFLTGRRLAGPIAGLLAAALLALSPLHAYQSHLVLPNAPTSFFALLSLWATLRYLQRSPDGDSPASREKGWRIRLITLGGKEHPDLVMAVIAASLGGAIKYNAVALLLIPLLAVYLERRKHAEKWLRRCIRLCFVSLIVFIVVTPPALLNTFEFVHMAAYQFKHYSRLGGGGDQPSMIWYGQYLIGHEGLLLFPVAVIGLTVLVWRRRYPIDLLLLMTIVAYYLLIGLQKAHYDRNLLVILPLLSVACAYVIVQLARLWRRPGMALALVSTVIVLGALGNQSIVQSRALVAPNPQIVTHTWLDQHLPPHATVLADGYTVPPLDRPDVTASYITDLNQTPDQLWQQGFQYAVISKSLWYYLNTPDRLWSPHTVMVPIYQDGGIIVFKINHHK